LDTDNNNSTIRYANEPQGPEQNYASPPNEVEQEVAFPSMPRSESMNSVSSQSSTSSVDCVTDLYLDLRDPNSVKKRAGRKSFVEKARAKYPTVSDKSMSKYRFYYDFGRIDDFREQMRSKGEEQYSRFLQLDALMREIIQVEEMQREKRKNRGSTSSSNNSRGSSVFAPKTPSPTKVGKIYKKQKPSSAHSRKNSQNIDTLQAFADTVADNRPTMLQTSPQHHGQQPSRSPSVPQVFHTYTKAVVGYDYNGAFASATFLTFSESDIFVKLVGNYIALYDSITGEYLEHVPATIPPLTDEEGAHIPGVSPLFNPHQQLVDQTRESGQQFRIERQEHYSSSPNVPTMASQPRDRRRVVSNSSVGEEVGVSIDTAINSVSAEQIPDHFEPTHCLQTRRVLWAMKQSKQRQGVEDLPVLNGLRTGTANIFERMENF
jgi:hypothetical protein